MFTVDKFVQVALLTSLMIMSISNSAAKDWGKKCNKKIPVPVPSFSCKDGIEVPKLVTGGKCKKPEDLYARCVHKSTLGRLEKGNTKGVDIIFSCRKDFSSDHKNDNGNKYFDIAVIQHDRNTGNTCFYQYLAPNGKDSIGENLPAPGSKGADKVWNENPFFCTMCHSNGPFVRSPHYVDVKDKAGDLILPSIYGRDKTKYKVLHRHYKVYDITKPKNACLSCHSIGAYKARGKFHIGQINRLAAGQVPSLRSHPSPTSKANPYPSKDGYHDFMVGMMGISSNEAKTALKELEGCLKRPRPKGCKVKRISK